MRTLKIVALVILLMLAFIQVLPYGRSRTNPPITGEPQWDSEATEAFARRACFSCHSNETEWPWYAYVAPMSWRVSHHVEEARSELNFSAFDQPQPEAHMAWELVQKGEMPPRDYLFLHPEGRLTDTEKEAFIKGLQATFGHH